jgi:uncharacterized protein with PQ loop repeat
LIAHSHSSPESQRSALSTPFFVFLASAFASFVIDGILMPSIR